MENYCNLGKNYWKDTILDDTELEVSELSDGNVDGCSGETSEDADEEGNEPACKLCPLNLAVTLHLLFFLIQNVLTRVIIKTLEQN